MGRKTEFGESYRVLPSGKVQLRYRTPEGERISAGVFDTRKAAVTAFDEVKVDLRRGDWRDLRKGKVLFADFVVEYMEYRKPDLAPGTYRNYQTLMRTMLDGTFRHRAMNDITVKMVAMWWSRHSDRPVNRRNAYFLLSNVMRTAVEWGVIATSPCIVKKAGKDVAEPRPTWTVQDFEAVMEHVPDLYRVPLEVMLAGHLRLGELVALNGQDYREGWVTVTKQKTSAGETTDTKTGQHKTIRLLANGVEAMDGFVRPIGIAPMFVGPTGARLPRQTLRRAWNDACEKAGFENFHLHDLRHIGLTVVGETSGLKVVQSRGGHASATASMRYQHFNVDIDLAAADRANERMAALRAAKSG